MEYAASHPRVKAEWIREQIVPLDDGVVMTSSDITEQKRAELALRESDERFQALLQHAVDVVCIVDAGGFIRYASPAVEHVLGYTTEEFLDLHPFDLLHPEDLNTWIDQWQDDRHRAPTPGSPSRCAHCTVTAGTAGRRSTSGTCATIPASRGYVVHFHDISQRKDAQQALAPPVTARRPHRSAQPRAAARPAGPRVRPQHPRPTSAWRPLPRHRPLQDGQRLPTGTRSATRCSRGRRSAPRRGPTGRHGRSPGRRRVRRLLRGDRGRRRRRRDGRPGTRRVRRAVRRPGPGDLGRHEHRDRARDPRDRDARGGRAQRRHRHVRRQGTRPRPRRALRRRAAPAGARPPRHRGGAPGRARARARSSCTGSRAST